MGQFVSMTSKEFRALLTKNAGSSPITTPFTQKTSKYHSEKAKADEKVFDSRKERNRYLELKKQQEDGLVSGLECQKQFVLQEGFRDNTGKWQRPITYICDFFYHDLTTDDWVVEDVKSRMTQQLPVYRLKKKLFLRKYPEYRFRECL